MSEGLIVICLSAAAGIVGTGLGGALGALLGGGGERTAAGAMGFASGIMIGLSAFEMLPSAAGALSGVMSETPAVFAAAAIALIGAALVMLAERALDRASAGRGEGNGGQEVAGRRIAKGGHANLDKPFLFRHISTAFEYQIVSFLLLKRKRVLYSGSRFSAIFSASG